MVENGQNNTAQHTTQENGHRSKTNIKMCKRNEEKENKVRILYIQKQCYELHTHTDTLARSIERASVSHHLCDSTFVVESICKSQQSTIYCVRVFPNCCSFDVVILYLFFSLRDEDIAFRISNSTDLYAHRFFWLLKILHFIGFLPTHLNA